MSRRTPSPTRGPTAANRRRFLPGGMGINFIKQFVAGGLSSEVPLVVPGFAADQDVSRAVGSALGSSSRRDRS